MPSRVDAESLLAVDVGSVTTRAMLFDVVDGRYRFVAVGTARSTAGAPFYNISEGVRLALDQLGAVTGRVFIGRDQQLIQPAAPDGSGVDRFAAVLSAGKPMKVVTLGLLESVSLESAGRLAQTTYSQIVDCLSLNDHRSVDARLNAIVRLQPDLMIVAGGTEGGASQSLIQLMEAAGLAGYLQPADQKPNLLYVGNSAVREEVEATYQGLVNLYFGPNIHPDLATEQLDAAHLTLARLLIGIRTRQIPGAAELDHWAAGGLIPAATGFGRMVRFLSKELATKKGVLGVDLGASAAVVAAGKEDELLLRVLTRYGWTGGHPEALRSIRAKDLARWIAAPVVEDEILNYLYNKSLNPAAVPATAEDLAVEGALTRYVLHAATRSVFGHVPGFAPPAAGLLPGFDAIICTGAAITGMPNIAQATLAVLDGLQPTGVTTLVFDPHGILPALGAAAAVNPLLVVQVLESNAFIHLGTVISPVSQARAGTPILRVKMTYESGHDTMVEARQGSMEVIPLPPGQSARMQIQPLHRSDVGMGAPGRGGALKVMGGQLGVVIDARGRPLIPPEDPARRQELFKKWLWTLGGQ